MNYGRTILRNVFSSWAGLLIGILISFFLAPFVVNHLGDTWYGVWVIMMQFTAYLYLMDFGVRESIIRYISKHKARGEAQELDRVYAVALLLYGLIAVLAFAVTGLAAWAFPYIFDLEPETVWPGRMVVLLVGGTIAQSFFFNVYRGILLGLQRYDLNHAVGVVTNIVRAALIVTFLSQGYGIVAMGAIQFVLGTASGVAVYFLAKRSLRQHEVRLRWRWIPLREQRSTLKQMSSYSFFVLVNNIGQKAIFSSDALIIGLFMPAAAVTYYAIAGNLIEYLRKLSTVTAEVLNPVTSELSSLNQRTRIQQVLVQGTQLSLLVGLPVAVVFILLGEHFISLWMGPKYGPMAGQVLAVLALGQILSFPHYTVNALLYGLSKHYIIAYWRIFEAVANVVLSLVLIQFYGIIGVAIGTVIPHLIVVAIALPRAVSRTTGISVSAYVRSAYLRPLVAVLPFALACYWAREVLQVESLFMFFTELALLMPIYVLSVWTIAFNRSDRQRYWSLLAPIIPWARRS